MASTPELVAKEKELRGQVLARAAAAEKQASHAGESFDIDKWAFGAPQNVKFPYGPPWTVRAPPRRRSPPLGPRRHPGACQRATRVDLGSGALSATSPPPREGRGPGVPTRATVVVLARLPLAPQPIVEGAPSVYRSFLGLNSYDYAQTAALGAVGFGIGFVAGHRVSRYSPMSPRGLGISFGVVMASAGLTAGLTRSAHRLMGFRNNGRPLRPRYEGWKDDDAPYFIKVDQNPRHPDRSSREGASSASAFR